MPDEVSGTPLIQHNNIAEQVFDILFHKILSNEWAPPTKIPSETDLCEMTGASRVSVRSAVQKMIALGLLEVRHGDGTFVKAFSLKEYLMQAAPFILKNETLTDITQFCEALEMAAIRLAMENDDPDERCELETLVKRCDECYLNADTQAYIDYGCLIHWQLCKMSRNNLILIMWDLLSQSFRRTIAAHAEVIMKHTHQTTNGYVLMIDAMKRKDIAQAQQQLHRLLNGIVAYTQEV